MSEFFYHKKSGYTAIKVGDRQYEFSNGVESAGELDIVFQKDKDSSLRIVMPSDNLTDFEETYSKVAEHLSQFDIEPQQLTSANLDEISRRCLTVPVAPGICVGYRAVSDKTYSPNQDLDHFLKKQICTSDRKFKTATAGYFSRPYINLGIASAETAIALTTGNFVWGIAAFLMGGLSLAGFIEKMCVNRNLEKEIVSTMPMESDALHAHLTKVYVTEMRELFELEDLKVSLAYSILNAPESEVFKNHFDRQEKLNQDLRSKQDRLNNIIEGLLGSFVAQQPGWIFSYQGREEVSKSLALSLDKEFVLPEDKRAEFVDEYCDLFKSYEHALKTGNDEQIETLSETLKTLRQSADFAPKISSAPIVIKVDQKQESEKGSYKEGDIISDYQLQSFLGQGAVGLVFKAKHLGSDLKVAIKLPASDAEKEHIIRDSKTLKEVSKISPEFVQYIDSSEDPPFLVMEYVAGKDLEGLIQNLSPKDRVKLAKKVVHETASALRKAHKENRYHLDLKPRNIFMNQEGCVKIGDFGLSIDVDDFELSRSLASQDISSFTSTMAYVAPEVLAGHPCAKSDVYSLGVTLYKVLTGELPTDLKLPSEMNPKVPKALDNTVKQMMERDPDKRLSLYQTQRKLKSKTKIKLDLPDLTKTDEEIPIDLTKTDKEIPTRPSLDKLVKERNAESSSDVRQTRPEELCE